MVLHDVANDAELVKVAAATLRAEGLLKGDDHAGNVVTVPSGAEDAIAEPQGHQVLHHLFAQVVINAVQLVLLEQGAQVIGQLGRAFRVLSEGFFHDDSGPAGGRHASFFNHGGHRSEDRGW